MAHLRASHLERLDRLQTLLYANNKHSLLLVFQAMDAAGKDSAIKHVMSGVNPQGCQVHSFRHPSAEELEHDFLWRAAGRLPERGHIGIFNRSYYEEVLIVRVHPRILAAENLPGEDEGKRLWAGRYQSIRDFERHLHRNGTRVLKFFLHVSKQEQRRRLLARLDEPEKHWKFSAADLQERAAWDRYMDAYAACLRHTSTAAAPWHVVPADDKPVAHLVISTIVLKALGCVPFRWRPGDL
jgi:PPK2 family polyphosphate:nucleotide phosphotransferase